LNFRKKNPHAFGISNTPCGKEHFSHGSLPLGQPSSERKAFFSPMLWEDPLRPLPLLPQGGGKGSRSLENLLDHQITNEKGKSSYDSLMGPLEIGSLSHTFKQDKRMMIPPSGQPYTNPALTPQRQDRFYSDSGKQARTFLDREVSSEKKSSRNKTKGNLDNSKVRNSTLPTKSTLMGLGFVLPIRGPLFLVDSRS
jgi:hypothetical protein